MLWKLNFESRCFIIGWKRARVLAFSLAFFFQFWDGEADGKPYKPSYVCCYLFFIPLYHCLFIDMNSLVLTRLQFMFSNLLLGSLRAWMENGRRGEIIKRELLTFKLWYLIELISFLLIADVTMFYVCYCRRVSKDKCDMKYNSIHEE